MDSLLRFPTIPGNIFPIAFFINREAVFRICIFIYFFCIFMQYNKDKLPLTPFSFADMAPQEIEAHKKTEGRAPLGR